MGCDIHLYVERKNTNREWEAVGDFVIDEEFYDKNDPDVVPDVKGHYYYGRNYDLFGILANVRNGRGFAGRVTGAGYSPIAYPKGLPDDIDPKIKAVADRWNADGHSHSYLTIREIIEYDWTQTTMQIATVNASEYIRWQDAKKSYFYNPDDEPMPETYGGVWSNDGPEVTETDMQQYIDELVAAHPDLWPYEAVDQHKDKRYCHVAWKESYIQAGKDFLGTVLPRLWRLGSPDDVRIVFWFDN